jgi:hypothetical protein
VQLEGIGQFKNPVTSSGIEPAISEDADTGFLHNTVTGTGCFIPHLVIFLNRWIGGNG